MAAIFPADGRYHRPAIPFVAHGWALLEPQIGGFKSSEETARNDTNDRWSTNARHVG